MHPELNSTRHARFKTRFLVFPRNLIACFRERKTAVEFLFGNQFRHGSLVIGNAVPIVPSIGFQNRQTGARVKPGAGVFHAEGDLKLPKRIADIRRFTMSLLGDRLSFPVDNSSTGASISRQSGFKLSSRHLSNCCPEPEKQFYYFTQME